MRILVEAVVAGAGSMLGIAPLFAFVFAEGVALFLLGVAASAWESVMFAVMLAWCALFSALSGWVMVVYVSASFLLAKVGDEEG